MAGTSPPYFLTSNANVTPSPSNARAFGAPFSFRNSVSVYQRWRIWETGVVFMTTLCSLASILSLTRLTSLRVSPVMTATREMFVGRPRSPYSSVAVCTKAIFAISENSRYPTPTRSNALVNGRSTKKIAPRICRWMSSCIGAKYIHAGPCSRTKWRAWEKKTKFRDCVGTVSSSKSIGSAEYFNVKFAPEPARSRPTTPETPTR